MDSDLPPNPEAHTAHVATAPPNHVPIHPNHPPYAEMIVSAIKALNEKKGSSRKAIAKFIDSSFTNLPQSHSALLTLHLKRLKRNGVVLMVKHSYKLPTSTRVSKPDGSKRGRGRPPKTKPMGLNPSGPGSPKRGRGRPRKIIKPTVLDASLSGSPKRGRGRPPKTKINLVPGLDRVRPTGSRPRGRPRKDASASVPVSVSAPDLGSGLVVVPPIVVSRGRPRGRPVKSKVGGVPKPKRVSTGRPVGRPRKVVSVVE